jgi:hypothetical protein
VGYQTGERGVCVLKSMQIETRTKSDIDRENGIVYCQQDVK